MDEYLSLEEDLGKIEKYDKQTLKYKDDVFYVPLPYIFEDKPIEWRIQTTLPKPSLIQYVPMRN